MVELAQMRGRGGGADATAGSPVHTISGRRSGPPPRGDASSSTVGEIGVRTRAAGPGLRSAGLLLFAIGLLLALVAGCSKSDAPPNVLLISVDTLRPDRLGYNGHPRPTSPNIDRLASESRVFKNAYSVSGWTLPSVATMMTGRYPRDHGATDFHWAMDAGLPTMAGMLRARGYDTRGYVSHVILKPGYGVAEGFKHFDFSVLNVGDPHNVSTAAQLTDLVLGDFKKIDKPFFVWVHYFDPHFAYLTHGEWMAFGDGEFDRYDQEIANTDRHIGRLIDALKRKKQYDNTIIIFTSDHGEEFGEHGAKYHYTLHEEVVKVPLLIKAPGAAAGVDVSPAEQTDLLPTVLGILGSDGGAQSQVAVDLPGRNLMTSAGGGVVFFERDRPPPYNQRGVLDGTLKLTVIEVADSASIPVESRGTYVPITNVHPGIYLFDLAVDPGERTNLYREDDPRAQALLVKLARHAAGEGTPLRPVDIDDNLRSKLRSLGYIK